MSIVTKLLKWVNDTVNAQDHNNIFFKMAFHSKVTTHYLLNISTVYLCTVILKENK